MDEQPLCFYCCYVILCKLILWLASVYDFPQAALSLNSFAYPWCGVYASFDSFDLQSDMSDVFDGNQEQI